MTTVDDRVVKVSLNVKGQLKTYLSPMYISSTGKICANPLQSEILVKIANVSKDDQDFLLTACSPYNKDKTPKILILEAGRESTGTSIIFQGNISTCEPSQPADIFLSFKCQANQALKGKIVASQQSATVPLSTIAQQVAGDCDLSCNFQATDKQIANYSHSGPALRGIDKIHGAGGVAAWADGDELLVTDTDTPLTGKLRVLDADSGMIGVPKFSEQGVKVTYLLDNTSKTGGALQIVSQVWPAINGNYRIYALGWNIASREEPFYWIAEAKRIDASGNTVIPTGLKKRKGKRA